MNNASNYYSLHSTVVDRQNNTIVGGSVEVYGSPHYIAASVTKIAPDGRILWEVRDGSEAFSGVDSLAVDKDGNVFFSVQYSFTLPSPIALVKLSPDGKELWRHNALYAGSQSTTMPSSTIRVDSAGDAFFLLLQFGAPGTDGPKQSLTKFDSAGAELWRVNLPGYHYFSDGGVAKTLALTQDGGAVIAGGYSPTPATNFFEGSGFAAKVHANGALDWLSADYKGRQRTGIYDSVAVSAKGTVCAASSYEGLTVFSGNGKALHTIGFGSETFGVTGDGEFLLTQFREKLCTLKHAGAAGKLAAYSDLFPVIAVLPDKDDNFLTVGIQRGSYPEALGFAQLDANGSVVWTTIFPNLFPFSWNRPSEIMKDTPVARASDGSARLVGNWRRFYFEPENPTVFAFAIDE